MQTVLRPVFDIAILGMHGTALIDTGAEHSIAGHTLYSLHQTRGHLLVPMRKLIKLADGLTRDMNVLTTTIDVCLQGKMINTHFIVLSEANDYETLLGIDFPMSANLCLDFSSQFMYFSDFSVRYQDVF